MNCDKNKFGKMFLILSLAFLFMMPFGFANGYNNQGGLGSVTSGLGGILSGLTGTLGKALSPDNPLGKVVLSTGLLAASYYATDALQSKLAGGSAAAKTGAEYGNLAGQIGGLVGGIFGGKTDKAGGAPGIGAIVGGLANFATTLISGLSLGLTGDKTIATVHRLLQIRVKTLDVNSAGLYEPQFKTHGSLNPTIKATANFDSERNFVRKSNDKYYVYYPIELQPNQKNMSELEHFVLGLDVKGLPENINKVPAKTLSDKEKYVGDDSTANIEAMNLDVTESIGWCHVKNTKRLNSLDTKVSNDSVISAIEEAQEDGRESFVLLFKNLKDEELSIKIPNYNCFGANGLRGATGIEYKPKVEYNWKYAADWLSKCSAPGTIFEKDSNDYIYCDALQFNMALLNLVQDVKLNTQLKSLKTEFKNTIDLEINEDTKEIYNTLNFRAYLMKDGYTKDFFNDFVDYALNTTFLNFPSNLKPVIEDLYEDKIEFRPLSYSSTNAEGYKLERAGMYNVTVSVIYKDSSANKQIVVNNALNSNIEKIIVYLEIIEDETNPIYYMPLDATMGVKNGIIERIGYGVDYKGDDAIWFKKGTDGMLLEPTLRSNSTPIVSLNMVSESSVKALNGFNKGLLLQISPRTTAVGATYEVKRYLSYPSPVGLEIKQDSVGDVYAFYTINVSNSPRNAGNSFLDWTLVCETGFDCTSFDGSSTLDEIGRADIYGVNSKVPIGQYQSVAYGLYWDKDSVERDVNTARYISLVYLPESTQGTMNIVLASNEESKLYPNSEFENGSKSISLSPYFDKINDLQEIYDLVETGDVCVGHDDQSIDIKFWWNPAKFLPETKTTSTGQPYPNLN